MIAIKVTDFYLHVLITDPATVQCGIQRLNIIQMCKLHSAMQSFAINFATHVITSLTSFGHIIIFIRHLLLIFMVLLSQNMLLTIMNTLVYIK